MSEPVKWSYYVFEDGADNIHEFKSWGFFPANDAARDYWDNNGGRKASWPIKIVILRNGKEFGRFTVHMDWETVIYAHKDTKEQAKDKEA